MSLLLLLLLGAFIGVAAVDIMIALVVCLLDYLGVWVYVCVCASMCVGVSLLV